MSMGCPLSAALNGKFAILLLWIISTVVAQNCSIAPLSLPLHNTTLLDGVSLNYGLGANIGGQAAGLRITTQLSNTRLRNSLDCPQGNASANSGCQGYSGSSFDIARSNTWKVAIEGKWNVISLDSVSNNDVVIRGNDVATFDGIPPIPDFPLEVWSNLKSDNRSGCALGPKSSFLQILLEKKLIPSKFFSLFYGSRSQTRGVNGNLTVGGYDKRRFTGEWTNFTTNAQLLNSRCPLQVRIADVRLNNIRGSFSLFTDPQATVAACVDPIQNAFTFSKVMYDRFTNLTEHPGNASGFGPRLFPLDKEPLIGNLTIKLTNGYTTTIPHYELVSQERGTDSQGKYAVVNDSKLMIALGPSETVDDTEQVPFLGGVYLSSNYLFVDYEREKWGMAEAVVGPLGDQEHEIVSECETSQNGPPPVASTKKFNVGAIAGGIVGGLAALLGLLFYAHRRGLFRKRKGEVGEAVVEREEAPPNVTSDQGPQNYESPQELPVSPSELSTGDEDPKAELAAISTI